MAGRATLFALLTLGGVVMAVIGLGVANPGVQLVLVAFGAAMFAGALAFFLVKWSA